MCYRTADSNILSSSCCVVFFLMIVSDIMPDTMLPFMLLFVVIIHTLFPYNSQGIQTPSPKNQHQQKKKICSLDYLIKAVTPC